MKQIIQLMLSIIVVLICSIFCPVQSDTPANCTFEDAVGHWELQFSDLNSDCWNNFVPTSSRKIQLRYPSVAIDEFGNYGFFTIIYNQGFEIVIQNMKYFLFFDYGKIGNATISICNRTKVGMSHSSLNRDWKCLRGIKSGFSEVKVHFDRIPIKLIKYTSVQQEHPIVKIVNNGNNLWKAYDYPEFKSKSIEELLQMVGGTQSRLSRPKSIAASPSIQRKLNALPLSFDWRNHNGVNYVSPVRNQGHCGSCYSFASAGMLEARFRIHSNNTMKPIISPQDVVECSPYSQGCSGGFPYLIAGKYAEDFGMVEESCNPYKGADGSCSTARSCHRYYATKYRYVGGFYGGCNEPEMMVELIRNGPVAVGFEVYPDFRYYKSGVYHHVFNTTETGKVQGLEFPFNPFELTNHAVLVVGYGVEDSVKHWIVKNSWGDQWGENGYFRIRRGNDECGIESLGVGADPIL